MTAPLSVVWCAPIYESSGYADEARGFLTALDAAGMPVVLRPVIERQLPGFREQLSSEMLAALTTQEQRAPTRPFLLVEHFPADGFVSAPGAAAVVGRTMFETDALPPSWVTRCNALDALWVPSQFNVDSFRRAGVRVPMHIVPGGVDSTRYSPHGPVLSIDGARGTVFLSVFEWRRRKGWDVLLRAWAAAFSSSDNVSLVLRTFLPGVSNADDSKRIINATIDRYLTDVLGKQRHDVAPIVVYPALVPEFDMPALYRAAHIYVSPTRGEGWGRPLMEAMATALPVIATRWSAPLEFMNHDNSLLLDIDGLVPAIDPDLAVYRGTSWAEPSASHLTQLLRQVVAEPERARAIGDQARQDMVQHWNWSRAADAIADGVREVTAQLVAAAVPPRAVNGADEARTVLLQAPVFAAREAPLELDELLGPLQSVLTARGLRLRVSGSETDERPPLSSSAGQLWRHRVLAHADAIAQPAVTVTCCTRQSVHELQAPPTGAWIVMTGDTVLEDVPPSMRSLLVDHADEVWVPHAPALAAALAIGIPASRLVRLPDTPVLNAATTRAMRSTAGTALSPRRQVLMPVAERADLATAELVVRLWPRVSGPHAMLQVAIDQSADDDVRRWAATLLDRTFSSRGLESVAVWSESFSPAALPVLLRGVDVMITPHVTSAAIRWWPPLRDLGGVLVAPEHPVSLDWPDDTLLRVPISATGAMSGAALGDTLKRLCAANSLSSHRDQIGAVVARLTSPRSLADQLADRIAHVLDAHTSRPV